MWKSLTELYAPGRFFGITNMGLLNCPFEHLFITFPLADFSIHCQTYFCIFNGNIYCLCYCLTWSLSKGSLYGSVTPLKHPASSGLLQGALSSSSMIWMMALFSLCDIFRGAISRNNCTLKFRPFDGWGVRRQYQSLYRFSWNMVYAAQLVLGWDYRRHSLFLLLYFNILSSEIGYMYTRISIYFLIIHSGM